MIDLPDELTSPTQEATQDLLDRYAEGHFQPAPHAGEYPEGAFSPIYPNPDGEEGDCNE